MPAELFIVGTGGLAKECAQLARQVDPLQQRWSTIKYVTNEKEQLGADLPYGRVEALDHELQAKKGTVNVVIAVGHPERKRAICQKLTERQWIEFPNLIHPSVHIDYNYVKIGHGNILTKGVVLTCDIKISNFNLLNLNCTIGHDAVIGQYNIINPGSNISGGVKIGDACLVGTGARIIENVEIGSQVVIGAGAVVTKSLKRPGVYVGVPARLREGS